MLNKNLYKHSINLLKTHQSFFYDLSELNKRETCIFMAKKTLSKVSEPNKINQEEQLSIAKEP